MAEAACWTALAYASGLKLAQAKRIIHAWCLEGGRPMAALFDLAPDQAAAALQLTAEERAGLAAAPGRISEQAAWLEQLQSAGTQCVRRADPRYPPALARWFPPALQPLLLFVRGDVGLLNQPSAAMIAARAAGAAALELARQMAALLAEEGLVVLSGLGKGAAQAAFDGALEIEGGRAAAVLPMGLQAFLAAAGPDESVAAAVRDGRALFLSPFHPDARFSEAQAAARNKLMVGLAQAVFVVAAGQDGLAREAADEALHLGKAVYVWDVTPEAEPAAAGNQALIQAGGMAIGGISDVLDALEAIVAGAIELAEREELPAAPSPPPDLHVNEEPDVPYDPQAVLNLLTETGRVPDVLARRLKKGKS
jgi:DNA processing protein